MLEGSESYCTAVGVDDFLGRKVLRSKAVEVLDIQIYKYRSQRCKMNTMMIQQHTNAITSIISYPCLAMFCPWYIGASHWCATITTLVKPVRHCILLRIDFLRLANGVDTRQSWCFWSDLCTPLKSNMAPENGGWKTILSYWEGNFSGANC